MSAKTYWEKLKDPRWQKKRLEIMERDKFQCQHCWDKDSTLNVHHKFYKKGADPWDYEDWQLITLCEKCHKGLEDTLKEFATFAADNAWQLEMLRQYAASYDLASITTNPIEAALGGMTMSYADFLNQMVVASRDIPGLVGKGMSAGFQASFARLVRDAAAALSIVENAIVDAAGKQ